jgi:hypothetical protein
MIADAMLSPMRKTIVLLIALCTVHSPAFAQTASLTQSSASDEALLAKTRALYDAPFTRDLVSFDCAVQFDWKEHFVDLFGTVPPAALPTVQRLQTIQHRVFVDRSGATVSAIPTVPDLADVEHEAELERGLRMITSGGLSAWLPFSMNVILPIGPTHFSFEKIDTGYKLAMHGPGIEAQLVLAADMRLTSGVSQFPQPMRFTTEFTQGPDGFLLSSVKTGNTSDTAATKDATFKFTYQTVQGFQLPSLVTVIPATTEIWHYALTDCKATKGITVKVWSPKSEKQ